MTIYYVDPWNGANTNSGLSWGAAWRWPPGNGAAVGPGDEIRVAKSPTVDGTYGYSFFGEQISGPSYGYGQLAYNTLFTVNLAGMTADYGIMYLAANTVVPANTKLGYTAVTTTSITTYASAEVKLPIVGVPTGAAGQYIRYALCSDAVGNTPVAWLDGPTILASDATYPTLAALTSFILESGANLSISVSSIAVYSGSSGFTAPSYGASIGVGSGIALGALSTSGQWLRPGSFFQHDTTDTPSYPSLGATPLDGYAMSSTSNGGTVSFTPPIKSSPYLSQYYGVYHYTQLTIYKGLPNPHLVYSTYEAPLTYSGSAALPIRISGGWDTGTNTQTGYTNLDLDLVLCVKRLGAFVFSSGGQYVQFSRFFSIHQPIVYYDYAVGTVHELKLYDCVYGNSEYNYGIGTSMLGVSLANTALTISVLWTERCTSYGLATVHRGPVYYFGYSQSGNQLADGALTFGAVDVVDCLIARPNFMTWYWKYTTHFKIRSSVASSIRSMVTSMNVSIDITVDPSPTARLEISDTTWSGYESSITPVSLEGASVFDVTLRNIWLTEHTSYTYYNSITLKYARDIVIDGLGFYTAASGSGDLYVRLFYTDTWKASNPTPTLAISGKLIVRGNLYYNAIEYVSPPTLIDGSMFTYTADPTYSYPAFTFTNVSPGTVIRNLNASAIIINPRYTGAPPYYQAANTISVYNCNGNILTSDTTPLGAVRAYDGSASPNYPYAALPSKYRQCSGVWPGVALYNYLIAGFSAASNNPGYAFSHREAIGVDLTTPSPVRPSGSSTTEMPTGQTYYAKDSVVLDADYLFNNLSSYSSGNGRGMLWRKADGTFLYKAGGTIAAVAPPANIYGKYPMRLIGTLQIASLDVVAGTVVTFSVRFKSTTASGYFILSVPPCLAFTTDLLGHVSRKNILTNEADILHSFSIAPTRDGTVSVVISSTVTITLKDFTVTVQ